MILVTGATGKSGREIVKQLSAAKASVRALVRDSGKAGDLAALPHVEIFAGDFNQPDTLDAALAGVERALLLSSPAPEAVELQGNFIEAAGRAQTRPHLVKYSALGADANAPEGFFKWHGQTEVQLAASGLSYTNLQPTMFMQEILNSWGGRGDIYLPMDDARIAVVDIRDIAAVAVKTLTEDGHAGKSYPITGPESLSFHDIAEKISAAIGKRVNYVSISPGDFRKALLGMQMSERFVDALVQLYDNLRAGGGAEVSPTVQVVAQKHPITFAEFAHEHAETFRG